MKHNVLLTKIYLPLEVFTLQDLEGVQKKMSSLGGPTFNKKKLTFPTLVRRLYIPNSSSVLLVLYLTSYHDIFQLKYMSFLVSLPRGITVLLDWPLNATQLNFSRRKLFLARYTTTLPQCKWQNRVDNPQQT